MYKSATPQTVQIRRYFLKKAALIAVIGLGMVGSFVPSVSAEEKKKILFFTKSTGFQHSVITRKPTDPEKLSYAEEILTDIGAKNGFEVTCSKDGKIFATDEYKKYDVYAFYTTGDLTKDSDKYTQKDDPNADPKADPKAKKKNKINDKLIMAEPGMTDAGKANLLAAIKGGKGFIAFHSGSDTFHSKGKPSVELLRDLDEKGQDKFDPYISMLGGEFIVHGAQQPSTLNCVDEKFPGAAKLKDATFQEEWYSLKNFAPDIHVIMVQKTDGMKGVMYERAPFPQTWARMEGKGRVFFTSLGHREDVWKREDFTQLVVGAMNWTTGKVDADVTPNIKTVTPNADPKPFKK